MQEVFDLIRLTAPATSTILILGESGTGKELVAKAIHHHSKRADGPFVTVNIVRRHGGELRVASHQGEGTEFIVELPRQQPTAESIG